MVNHRKKTNKAWVCVWLIAGSTLQVIILPLKLLRVLQRSIRRESCYESFLSVVSAFAWRSLL